MPKIRLLLVGHAEELAVADELVAQAAGMTLTEMAELGGALVDIPIQSPTWDRQQEITRQGLAADGDKGFREDAEALALARVRVMVKHWPEALKPFVEEQLHPLLGSAERTDVEAAFRLFPATLSNAVHGWILQKMYPTVMSMPDFSKAWSDKQQPSGTQRSTPAD